MSEFPLSPSGSEVLFSEPLQSWSRVREGQLPNGMKYKLLRNVTPPNKVEAHLKVDVGSIDEEDDELGLAHFLEHVVFLGTSKFEDSQTLKNLLAKWGMDFGGDTNASTSFRETIYTLSVPIGAATEEALKHDKRNKWKNPKYRFHSNSLVNTEINEDRKALPEDTYHHHHPHSHAHSNHHTNLRSSHHFDIKSPNVSSDDDDFDYENNSLIIEEEFGGEMMEDSEDITKESKEDHNLYKVLEVLYELSCNAKLRDHDIDRERGAVLSELRDDNDVANRVYEKWFTQIMNKSYITERFIIGKKNQLEKFKSENFVKFYTKHYRPQNFTLYIVGQINYDQTESWINEIFGKISPDPPPPAHVFHPSRNIQFIAPNYIIDTKIDENEEKSEEDSDDDENDDDGDEDSEEDSDESESDAEEGDEDEDDRKNTKKKKYCSDTPLYETLFSEFESNISISFTCISPLEPTNSVGDLLDFFLNCFVASVFRARITTQFYKHSELIFNSIWWDFEDSYDEGCKINSLNIESKPKTWKQALEIAFMEAWKLAEYGISEKEFTYFLKLTKRDFKESADLVDTTESYELIADYIDATNLNTKFISSKQTFYYLYKLLPYITRDKVNEFAKIHFDFVNFKRSRTSVRIPDKIGYIADRTSVFLSAPKEYQKTLYHLSAIEDVINGFPYSKTTLTEFPNIPKSLCNNISVPNFQAIDQYYQSIQKGGEGNDPKFHFIEPQLHRSYKRELFPPFAAVDFEVPPNSKYDDWSIPHFYYPKDDIIMLKLSNGINVTIKKIKIEAKNVRVYLNVLGGVMNEYYPALTGSLFGFSSAVWASSKEYDEDILAKYCLSKGVYSHCEDFLSSFSLNVAANSSFQSLQSIFDLLRNFLLNVHRNDDWDKKKFIREINEAINSLKSDKNNIEFLCKKNLIDLIFSKDPRFTRYSLKLLQDLLKWVRSENHELISHSNNSNNDSNSSVGSYYTRMIQYFRNLLRGENMEIVIIGDIKPRNIIPLLEAYLADLPAGDIYNAQRDPANQIQSPISERSLHTTLKFKPCADLLTSIPLPVVSEDEGEAKKRLERIREILQISSLPSMRENDLKHVVYDTIGGSHHIHLSEDEGEDEDRTFVRIGFPAINVWGSFTDVYSQNVDRYFKFYYSLYGNELFPMLQRHYPQLTDDDMKFLISRSFPNGCSPFPFDDIVASGNNNNNNDKIENNFNDDNNNGGELRCGDEENRVMKRLYARNPEYISVVWRIIQGIINNRLFQDIREKNGWVYYINFFSVMPLNLEMGYSGLEFSSAPKNAKVVIENSLEILKDIIVKKNFTKEEFDAVKNPMLSAVNSDEFSYSFWTSRLFGLHRNWNNCVTFTSDIMKRLEAIGMSDVKFVLENIPFIDFSRIYTSVASSGPTPPDFSAQKKGE